MSAWTCAACGALGSEFDAQCRECGGPMPALSLETPSSPPPADPWLGRAIAGYHLLERIGSGGMGVVYLAEAPADPARGWAGRAAVKLLSPELLPSAEARARFAREARAASLIRSPHVVRILDHGTWEGQPFLAMELCHGEDLAARLRQRGRLSPEETAALASGVAAALDAAHAAGVIHRDLKPENVFLAMEGEGEVVKVLDFGVAKLLQGRDAAVGSRTRTGTVVGTPHYMSPEQADGARPVDHRSDLWSLAVIVFRCLTGKLPFDSAALGDLLMRIMSYPLPSLAAAAGAPAGLDGWWRRAASRDVAERFASAGEMARALAEALLSPPRSTPSPDTARPVSGRAGSLEQPLSLLLDRPVPFVGRARELATLTGLFEECESGPVAQAALVLGGAGIGKSRLRQELVAALSRRARAPEVWIARGDPEHAGSPFGMISGALRREAGVLDGEPAAAQRRKLEGRFGPVLQEASRPSALGFLGELCSVPIAGEGGPELAAARESPVLMGDQIHRAFEDLAAADRGGRALLLVLEDVHWADWPSLDLVDSALRNAPHAPLFVLALGRPEVTADHPDLWAERRLQTLRLGELLPRQSESIVRAALGNGIEEAIVGRLVERSAGNPLFLQELIRSHAEGRGLAMPETVLAILEARLARLDPAARRVLMAGSLFGRTFWREGALALLGEGLSAGEVDAAIETCVRREVLVRHRSSRLARQTEVAFRHALVRDAAFAMMEEGRRAEAHLRAAEWLERAGEHDMAVLAEHFERGGSAARAAEAYRRAAVLALEGNDFAAAIEGAERAIAAFASGEAKGALRRLQAEAHGYRDEHAAAQGRGREAMQLLPAGSAAWCVAAACAARASASTGDAAALSAIAGEVLQSGGADPGAHQMTCAARVAGYLYASDRRAEADDVLGYAESLAGRARAPGATAPAWLCHARAWRAFAAGDAAGSLEHEAAAVAAFELAGDERNACYIRVGLGHAYREVGALAEAEAVLREAQRTAARLGLPNILLGAQFTLCSVLFFMGRPAEARGLAEASLAGFVSRGDGHRAACARLDLARILAADGDLPGARAEAEAAERALSGAPATRAYALGVLAAVRLLAGEAREALAAAREAMGLMEEAGGIPEGEGVVRLAHVEALLAAGEAGATEALAAARSRLLERAGRIGEARLRAGFLERIPENAALLALASRAGAGL